MTIYHVCRRYCSDDSIEYFVMPFNFFNTLRLFLTGFYYRKFRIYQLTKWLSQSRFSEENANNLAKELNEKES